MFFRPQPQFHSQVLRARHTSDMVEEVPHADRGETCGQLGQEPTDPLVETDRTSETRSATQAAVNCFDSDAT